uniref:F-box C protein n=1 Tax=Steinernema glaseri TaxID=37863 RepID=A0A1I7YZZ5_9BILA
MLRLPKLRGYRRFPPSKPPISVNGNFGVAVSEDRLRDASVPYEADHNRMQLQKQSIALSLFSHYKCVQNNHIQTTMDAVPYKFVDSVVELFDGKKTLNPLAREVKHPLWKAVVDVHHRNREYYDVCVRITKDDAQLAARKNFTEIYGNLESIQKNSRFARIKGIYDLWLNLTEVDNVQLLAEAEAVKQLKKVALQFEQGSFLISASGLANAQKVIVPSLFDSVSLGAIHLTYQGQITLDFLEDQISNSPYLDTVHLYGDKWPQSVLPLVESFCLKGRPGKRVELSMVDTAIQVDTRFIIKLLDHWKVSRNLNFRLRFHERALDLKGRDAFLNLGFVSTDAHRIDPMTAFGISISIEYSIWHLKFSPANTARQSYPEELSALPQQGSFDFRNSEDSVKGKS